MNQTSDAVDSPPRPLSLRLLPFAAALALVVAAAGTVYAPLYLLAALVVPAALVAFASERSLKYAIFALALYTPFEEFVLKWLQGDLFFAARFGHYAFIALCFAFIWLRRGLEGRALWKPTPLDLPFVLLLVAIAVSYTFSAAPPLAAAFNLQPLLRFMVIVFFALQFIEFEKRDLKILIAGLYCVAFMQCLIGFVQAAGGPTVSTFLAPVGEEFMGHAAGGLTQVIFEGPTNIFATFGRYNTFGLFLGMCFILSLPLYAAMPHWRPYLWFLYPVLVPCLILTVSRSGWVATFAVGLCYLAIRRNLLVLVAPIAGAAALLGIAVSSPEQVQWYGEIDASPVARLLEAFSPTYWQRHFHYSRLYFILVFPFDLIDYSLQRFLFGFGPGSLGPRAENIFALYPLEPLGVPPENHHFIVDVNWAFLLGQIGAVGLALFLWGLLRLFRNVATAWRAEEDPFLKAFQFSVTLLIPFFFIGGFFWNIMEVRPLSLYFWLFVGIAVKFARERTHPPGTMTADQSSTPQLRRAASAE